MGFFYIIIMEHLILFLFLITGFIYDTSVIDVIGIQWLYLGGINILAYGINLYKGNFNQSLKDLKKVIYIYGSFIFISVISIYYAVNWTLSILEIARQLIFLSTITNLYFLFKQKTRDKLFYIYISRVFLLVLSIEISNILVGYLTNFNTAVPRQAIFHGYSTNVNIVSMSMLLKLPFVIFLIFRDKLFYKIISISNLILFNYFIFWTQSRATFLAFILISFLLLMYVLKNQSRKVFLKTLMISLLTFAFSLGVSNFFIKKNSLSLKITDRTLNERILDLGQTEDGSTQIRLKYWSGGIKQIIKSPIIGVGIGNWKLNSLEYDSTFMNSYTVQYHMHNDFLQAFAELGLIGFIVFSAFILFIFYSVINQLFKGSNTFFTFCLLLSLIVYCTDAFFNFPHERSEIQSIFAVIISVAFLKHKTK